MQENNELKINLKYLAHYTLSWIAYINDQCKIYKIPKARNHKYLVKIYWMPSKAKYKNANYMYG